MVRDCAGAKTLEGSSYSLFFACSHVRNRVRPGESRETPGRSRQERFPLKRVSAWEESGRNPGQGVRERTLEGKKPKGASSDRRTKHALGRQGLLKGSKPRNRGLRDRPSALVVGTPAEGTVGGSIRTVTDGCLSRGESSEG
jgi:hypothetical protein